MKQEENKDFLAEDLKLEGVENAENKEAGKEKKKRMVSLLHSLLLQQQC